MSSSNELPDFLQNGNSSKRSGLKKTLWGVGGVGIAAVLYLAFAGNGNTQAVTYLTEEAATGSLVVATSASGTLAPTRSVDVGSELSGTIEAVLVDENDQVTKGQIVARLDTAKLQDAVTKSRAAVTVAEAAVAQMEATAAEAKANLARQRQVAELSGGKVPSKAELDTAEAAYQRAQANVESAKASVVQARAALKTDETNIAKSVIRSPINGVVLTRKVEPGQTVAATMTAPVLLTIAEDLTKMELQVKVDEADVSTVKLGQPASFTVSAWGNRQFPATIKRVGIGSTTTDNVVTYKTILSVDNKELALRPGMTGTARIVTAKHDDVLLVPNAALRFSPTSSGARSNQQNGLIASLMPRPPRMPGSSRKGAGSANGKAAAGEAQVWVLENGQPVSVKVIAGLSNGKQTEITGGDLKAGMAVITDVEEAKK